MKIKISEMIKPALIGGAVSGVLSGLPFIGFLNILCCMLYVGGGGIAAYVLIKSTGKISLEEGAVVGGISGVFAGIISGVLGLIFNINQAIANIPGARGVTVMVVMASIIINVILGVIFGAIGGVIVAKLKE